MNELKEMHCTPIAPDQSPLDKGQIDQYLNRLNTPWDVEDQKVIRKEFPFENFKRGMAFIQEIGMLAERENHHPDLSITYDSVEVTLGTHSVGGLTENDFILAAKIDAI